MDIFFYGVLFSGTMIMAIGAQNAHVIKYGLLGKNIFYVCLTCFFCDFVLMGAGIFLVGSLATINFYLNLAICIFAIIFLLGYAANSFIQAYKAQSALKIDNNSHGKKETIGKTIAITLAITLLNPHVYLDTVVLIGGYASSLSLADKYYFLSGALLASFCWFFAIGYLSQYLKTYLTSPKVWSIFNFLIGIFMLFIAINLVIYLYNDVIYKNILL